MIGVELCKRIVDLAALGIGPRLLWKLGSRLDGSPASKRASGQHEAPTAASSAHDPASGRVERGCATGLRHLAAMHASVERRRKAEDVEHPDLKANQGFLSRRTPVEPREQRDRSFEHRGLRLVIGDTLANHRKRCARCGNCIEASQDVRKGAFALDLFEMVELAASGPEVGTHQHVGLKRTTKAPLAPSRAASKRGDLAEVFGQECDDSIGISIIDRTQ